VCRADRKSNGKEGALRVFQTVVAALVLSDRSNRSTDTWSVPRHRPYRYAVIHNSFERTVRKCQKGCTYGRVGINFSGCQTVRARQLQRPGHLDHTGPPRSVTALFETHTHTVFYFLRYLPIFSFHNCFRIRFVCFFLPLSRPRTPDLPCVVFSPTNVSYGPVRRPAVVFFLFEETAAVTTFCDQHRNGPSTMK